MKVVIDTNIWVSAWLWRGIPGNIIRLGRTQAITICTSEALLTEFKNILSYAKFQQKIQSLNFTKEELIAATRELARIYPIQELNVSELRDPDDNIVLATAMAANADAIVSGDRDLLVLGEYQGIQIVTAQDFLRQYFNSD